MTSMQGWATLAFWLCLLLGAATGLFVTFFSRDDWRVNALDWSVEHDQPSLHRAIASEQWLDMNWETWATIGLAGTATLGLLGIRGFWRSGRLLKEIPGLASVVAEERRKRQENAWALMGCMLLLLFLPVAVLVGMAQKRE